ncbi:hypothetical protein CaCOL14_001302 [Colletotrichum acutatum]
MMNFPLLYSIWVRVEDFLCHMEGSRTSSKNGLQQYDEWTYKAWVRNKDPDRKSQFPNLLNVMVSAGVPTQTALSEAKENLGPGTDTTSASLAHILYALSWNPTYQQKLYQDLASRGFPTDFNTLENIPRLKACVKEGIRWAGASVAMLPRVVPKGGVELCGNFIPEGVSHHHSGTFSDSVPSLMVCSTDYRNFITGLVPQRQVCVPESRVVQSLPLDR